MRSSCLAVLLVAAVVLGCAAVAGAHAENWVDSGNLCLDIDSVHLANEKADNMLVAYRVSTCENGRPKDRTFLIGVKRQDCPAIINGAAPIAHFMLEPTWSHWQQVDLKDGSFRGLAYVACRRKGAPDGLVVFENDLSQGDATIYVDGTQVCRLSSAADTFVDNSCDVDLRKFGTDSEYRHAVRIVAPQGDVNDTISISDCHWNWQGTKEFDIMDAKVHFDCM